MFTTNPGLEPVVAEELVATLGPVTITPAAPGYLLARAEAPEPVVTAAWPRLQSVQHVLSPLARRTLPDPPSLADVRAAVAELELPALRAARSFRVEAVRVGQHPFTRVEVAQKAGGALVARHGTRVDLSAPEVTVRVDLAGRELLVSLPLTHAPLHTAERPFRQRVGLKRNVAFAAVHLAGLTAPAHIADPFCGSGTILLEAGYAHPNAQLWGSDWVARAAQGTLQNLEHDGFGARAHVQPLDVRAIRDVYPVGRVDAVICNPPFGVQVGRKIKFFGFYRGVLELMKEVLRPGGRLVLLTDRKQAFDDALRHVGGFRRLRALRVETGELAPWLVAVERLSPG